MRGRSRRVWASQRHRRASSVGARPVAGRAGARPSGRTWAQHRDRGRGTDAAVHALHLAMNEALETWGGRCCTSIRSSPIPTTGDNDLALLTEELQRGAVQALVIIGANPVYTAPADLKFADALTAQENSATRCRCASMGLYENETALLCHWHIPNRTIWNPGATSVPSKAPPPSSSPLSRRSTRAARPPSW